MGMSKFASVADYFAHAKQQQGNRTEEKPVVKYNSIGENYKPRVGQKYSMIPVDHPAEYLNGKVCESSTIVSVDGDNFETLNTRYVLDK